MIPSLFPALVILVAIDIVSTVVCVGVLGATEINPLARNLPVFMILKIVVSVIGLFMLSKMRGYPGWIWCVGILVVAYGVVFLFNIVEVAYFLLTRKA